MSESSAHPDASTRPNLLVRLRRAYRRQQTLLVLRGGLALMGSLAVLALVDLALDWSLALPGAARVVVLAANAVLLGYVAWRLLGRTLRRFSALRMALRVESRHPELESVLVSAVQFAEDPTPAPGASASLMRAVQADAVYATAPVDFGKAVPVRRVPATAGGAVLALAGVFLVGVISPQALSVLVRRMLNPATDAAYPTRTRVELVTGDVTVLVGRPVDLAARVTGELPDEGTVALRADGLDWEQVSVERDADGLLRFRIPEVLSGMDYYFRAGDGRSAVARVTAEAPPRVVAAEALLTYPDYLDRKPDTSAALNLRVPENTRVRWTLKFDRPVVTVAMDMQGQTPPAVRLAGDGRSAVAETAAHASGSYQFQLHWRFAGDSLVEPAAKHFLRVVPDNEPRAVIAYPVDDQKATLHKTLIVRYIAGDDHGLARAWLIYAINDGTEQRRDLGPLGGEPNVEREVRWKVADDLPDLREGDLMTYSIEVSDARPGDEPDARGRSQSRRVQFVSAQEYLLYALAQQRKYLGQIRPLYTQELEAAGVVRRLAPPGSVSAPADDEPEPAPASAPTQPATSRPTTQEAP